MSVERIEITHQEPYADGQDFGAHGPFELIRARLRYAVNPMLEDHRRITDLECANRGTDGCVRFSGDLVLIRPQDSSAGNCALVIDVPNRGRSLLPSALNRTPPEFSLTDPLHPGDGFLFSQGFSVASVAWQWNTPDMETLLDFEAPEALGLDGNSISGEAITDLRPSEAVASMPIEHLAQPGYPVSDNEDGRARLYERDFEDDEPREIPRDRWRFARQTADGVVPSTRDLWIEDGFTPGKIYEVVYPTDRSPVVGTGLLAFRDAALFLRNWQRSYERVHGFGISQSGRFLRHLLYLGLNRDPDAPTERAFDGMHIHVAGGIRGEFNRRYGQPSQLFLAGPIHEFPFADVTRDDSLTDVADGLLKRSDEQGVTPKIVKTNTSWEYWRGDASLIDIDPATGEDIPQHPDSRHYLLACTQHGAGQAEPIDSFYLTADRSMYRHNAVDQSPLMRAALVNLDRWTAGESEPPPTCVPSLSNGTAATRDDVLSQLSDRVTTPDADRLSRVRTVDWSTLPPVEGDEYQGYVSAIDDVGNEVAGLRLPDLTQPLGLHTGWNPRHPETGGEHLTSHFVGLTQWLSRDEILARYGDRASYLDRVRADAERLATDCIILAEDIDLVVANCAERWDVAVR
ncbi:MAG: alpha/beta hydrolase domain-containing protein [Chloroflexota bacterium]|nr:alpha/beta hydrolase domain-containing protein [Chloroflexota bacterium]MDE2896007.1 alpha/beta hydrolase domain-containing protein [Chloroflexota bacterium]